VTICIQNGNQALAIVVDVDLDKQMLQDEGHTQA